MRGLIRAKSLIFLLIVTILTFSIPVLTLAEAVEFNEEEYIFDEYGFRLDYKQRPTIQTFSTNNFEWETFPSKSNVPLDKMWTVEFSRSFNIKEVDAAVIEHGNQFIPVTITKTASNKLAISPRDGFAGNTNYTLKIFLSNGKRYKMDFTTRASNRKADFEPNNTYLEASRVYINEVIEGEVVDRDVDFYKVEIPSYGVLRVNLTGYSGSPMSLYLYGPEGTNKSSIKSKSNFTQGNISAELEPGTYYIRVTMYNDNYYSPYKLDIKFD